MPNCNFMENVEKRRRIFLSLSKPECGPQEINPWKICLHFTFQQIGINAAKFDETLMHFKSDVFAAVAVVDAKVPF